MLYQGIQRDSLLATTILYLTLCSCELHTHTNCKFRWGAQSKLVICIILKCEKIKFPICYFVMFVDVIPKEASLAP